MDKLSEFSKTILRWKSELIDQVDTGEEFSKISESIEPIESVKSGAASAGVTSSEETERRAYEYVSDYFNKKASAEWGDNPPEKLERRIEHAKKDFVTRLAPVVKERLKQKLEDKNIKGSDVTDKELSSDREDREYKD